MFRSRKIIELTKPLFGYLPVYKPRGIPISSLIEAVENDIYFTRQLAARPMNKNQAIKASRFLGSSSEGLVTIVFCDKVVNMERNFALAEYQYKTTVEFDQDSATSDEIGKAIDTMRGRLEQVRSSSAYDTFDERDTTREGSLESYYERMRQLFVAKEKAPRIPQKYPPVFPPHEIDQLHIELIDHSGIQATFLISSQGSPLVSELIEEIGNRIGRKLRIVSSIRTREGPMSVEDMRVLRIHELNLEYYIERIELVSEEYNDYLSNLDQHFAKAKKYNRLI